MTNIERKSLTAELKADGRLTATFSRFGVVDRDGDVTLPSAIPDGLRVPLGAYNHSSILGSNLPVGRARVVNDGHRAYVEAEFFGTSSAEAHYQTIKALGDLCEYSYAFAPPGPDQASTDYAELRAYGPEARRILKGPLEIAEICAVIKGAGIATGTDSIKAAELLTLAQLGIEPEFSELIEGAAVAGLARDVRKMRREIIGFADDFDRLVFIA